MKKKSEKQICLISNSLNLQSVFDQLWCNFTISGLRITAYAISEETNSNNIELHCSIFQTCFWIWSTHVGHNAPPPERKKTEDAFCSLKIDTRSWLTRLGRKTTHKTDSENFEKHTRKELCTKQERRGIVHYKPIAKITQRL